MSDLRPTGEPFIIEGEERHFLFTLNVIDEIQDHFSCSMEEAIDKLTDKKESVRALRFIVASLLNDEADRTHYKNDGSEMKKYTEKEIGWMLTQDNILEATLAVLRAYGLSLPEANEFDHPNQEGRPGELT